MKKKNFRDDSYYKSLSLFLVGTIGTLLLAYVTFGLVMTAIKTHKLVDNKEYKKTVSEAGVVKKQFESEVDVVEEVDVVAKELHGKVISIQGNVIVIETKVYGNQNKQIKLRFEDEKESKIVKYLGEQEQSLEISDLKEGEYIGVQLPVEMLLSELEKDVIFVDNLIVDSEYKEGEEE